MGVNEYKNWNIRPSDCEDMIPFYKRMYFLCEGANTEKFYFEKFIDKLHELGVPSTIEVIYLEKTEEIKDMSFPAHLIEYANQLVNNKTIVFEEGDTIFVIFDADIYQRKITTFEEDLAKCANGVEIGVTNPNFELFLLLHQKDAYKTIIYPRLEDLLKDEYLGSNSLTRQLVLEHYGINPKTNKKGVEKIVEDIYTAIKEEKNINQDIEKCIDNVTSNIGQIIESIINANRKPY